MPTRGPPLSYNKLVELAATLDHNSLALSTHRGYDSANKSWALFIRTYGFPERPSSFSLRLYAAFLAHRGIKHPDKFFSALAYKFGGVVRDWESIRSHPDVTRALVGATRANARMAKRSPPLLPEHLVLFLRSTLSRSRSHDDLLALAMAVIGFGALLRLGEMVEPQRLEDRDPRKYIRRDSSRLVGDSEFHFKLPYHKADRMWKGSNVVILDVNSIPDFNFVKLIRLYLASRDRTVPSSPFLFVRSDGSLPPREWFIARLRVIAPSVSGHGLRAGGATFLSSIGVSAEVIMRMGRWSSAAWQVYLRSQPALLAAVNRVELSRRHAA